MVKKYNQDPLHVYPFIQLIENVLYGALMIDATNFIKAMEIFGRVYQALTGSKIPFNPDTMTFEAQLVEEVSMPSSGKARWVPKLRKTPQSSPTNPPPPSP